MTSLRKLTRDWLDGLRRMRHQATGGYIRPSNAPSGRPLILSPGRSIIDPDEAEALGLTTDARRMRGESAR